MIEKSKVEKIANKLDRTWLRRVFQMINEMGLTKHQISTDFSDEYYESSLGISAVTKINSIPEDDFQKMCEHNKFPKEVEKLYLVLTGQKKPEHYMEIKYTLKKRKITNDMPRVPVEGEKKPRKKREQVPETPKKKRGVKSTEERISELKPIRDGCNEFNMKEGTISYNIAYMIMQNKYTIQEIAERTGKTDPYVHQVISRMKKHPNYIVFDERSAGRKIIGCEKRKQ